MFKELFTESTYKEVKAKYPHGAYVVTYFNDIGEQNAVAENGEVVLFDEIKDNQKRIHHYENFLMDKKDAKEFAKEFDDTKIEKIRV
jgi:hypothetical protein